MTTSEDDETTGCGKPTLITRNSGKGQVLVPLFSLAGASQKSNSNKIAAVAF